MLATPAGHRARLVVLLGTSAGLLVRFPGLLDVGEDAGQEFFEVLEGFLVGGPAGTEGVNDIAATEGVVLGELGDEVGFVRGGGEIHLQSGEMVAAHGEDVGGALEELPRDGAAAVAGEIVAEGAEELDRMTAGGLARHGADASAEDLVVATALHQTAKERLCHGAAAGISGTDEEDAFQRMGGGGFRLHPGPRDGMRPAKGWRESRLRMRRVLSKGEVRGSQSVSDLRIDRTSCLPKSIRLGFATTRTSKFGMAERYKIYEKLGAGGVGAVFRAYDSQLKRWVAIKRLLSATESSSGDATAAELRREADSLASMRNPNIVSIFDVATDTEGTFMVMELLEGEDLADVVARGPLHYDDFKELANQTLEGLLAAHHRHILHRDIKPENIKIERLPGGRLQSKIIDFGLARAGLRARKQTEDQEGTVMGSIYYMAPEQLTREPVDERTDLYSLGCVFFEALSGRKAFDGESMGDVIDKHINHEVTPLHVVAPHVPPWLGAWVLRLMAGRPEDRPANAQQAIEEFRAWEKMAAAPMAMQWAQYPGYGGGQTQPMTAGNSNGQMGQPYYPTAQPVTAYVEPVLTAQPVVEMGAHTAPLSTRPVPAPNPGRTMTPPPSRRPTGAAPTQGNRTAALNSSHKPTKATAGAGSAGGANNTKLYAMIGGGVVVLGVLAYLFLGKDKGTSDSGGSASDSPLAVIDTGPPKLTFELPRDRAFPPADRDMVVQLAGTTGVLSNRKNPDGNPALANENEAILEWRDLAERGNDNFFRAYQNNIAYGPKRILWPPAPTGIAGVRPGKQVLDFKPRDGKACGLNLVDTSNQTENFPFGGGKLFTGDAGMTLGVLFQADPNSLPTRILTLSNDSGSKVILSVTATKQVAVEFQNGGSSSTIFTKDVDPTIPCVAAISWNAKTGATDLRARDVPNKYFRAEGTKVSAPNKALNKLQLGMAVDSNGRTPSAGDQFTGVMAEVILYAAALRNDQIQLLEKTLRDSYIQGNAAPTTPPPAPQPPK